MSALQGGGRWFDPSYAHPNPVTGKDTRSAYRPQHATEAHRRVSRKPSGGSGRRRGSGEDEPLGARMCLRVRSADRLLVGLFFQFFGIRLGVQRVEGGQARIFDRPVGEVDGV